MRFGTLVCINGWYTIKGAFLSRDFKTRSFRRHVRLFYCLETMSSGEYSKAQLQTLTKVSMKVQS